MFERRDGRYWIQAIADNQGTVVLYTVTTCDDSFKPQIRYSPRERIIILGESAFSEVGNDNPRIIYHYFISGATSNSYLIEVAYLGNPGDYQTEFWGINDVCDGGLIADAYKLGLPEELISNGEPQVDIEDQNLTKFRENFPINTYGISSPFADIDTIMDNFQIGVDRIQIRVVYPK